MLSSAQRTAVETLIRDVGLTCVAPYFRNLRDGDIRFKSSPNDPVSVADELAEKTLREGLQGILPEALFLGEETYAADPSVLRHLAQSERPVWVVDPLDGTSNFVHGHEGFGPIMALVQGTDIYAGWMFEVCSQTLSSAYRGDGIRINGQAWQDARPQPDILKGQIGRKIYKFPQVKALESTQPDLRLIAEGTPSILSYTRLLSGELDFLIYKKHAPWDHLPGFAFLAESGGAYEGWGRSAHQFTDISGGLIVARSQPVMDRVQTSLISPLFAFPEIINMDK